MNIFSVIENYDRIAIFRHVRPDFDAYGSQYGLAMIIQDLYPEKIIMVPGEKNEKMLQQIITLVDNLYKSTNRPKKLSFSLVQKSFNLPQKQIYKLPRCVKYIEDHMESQEQYWAREVEWAIKSLDSDGISWSKIQKLLNIKKLT